MRNVEPAGPLCGCGSLQTDCEIGRELDAKACCWACEHHALPPDIRVAPTPEDT